MSGARDPLGDRHLWYALVELSDSLPAAALDEVIESALKDREPGVPFVAKLVAGQLNSEIDYAAQIRQAYAAGIDREAMGTAFVGQPAPDFTALTIDGKPFQLSSVLGKKPIAIYFAAFDG